MTRWALRALLAWLALLVAAAAPAQTRAWLDRARIADGETVALNIQTDEPVAQIDYAPLAARFALTGQSVRRQVALVDGRLRRSALFAVGLRPPGPGTYVVPALQVGGARTAPLTLEVVPAAVAPAAAASDVFVESAVDAPSPYVQQAVGLTVRLHSAVPLLSGQLDQDAPEGASLQRVGEDLSYERILGGRRYHVVERHYLLVPERSGPLQVPGARFNGLGLGDGLDALFGDGRRDLSAAAPPLRLQVRPIPADAPLPWLPLRGVQLRWLQAPTRARVGEAVTAEFELQADGASTAQLPALAPASTPMLQVFADPPQRADGDRDGVPLASVRQRLALVPQQAGTLTLPGPQLTWWNAERGVRETTRLPPLRLQVAPGAALPAAPPPSAPAAGVPAPPAAAAPAESAPAGAGALALVGGLGVLLAVAAVAWWRRRGRVAAPMSVPAAPPPAPALAQALRGGDLAQIAHALQQAAAGEDLDALRARLADPAQAAAVQALQQARWGGGDAAAALAQLRAAFARGPRWRRADAPARDPLPPLYPPASGAG
ncbi:protein BatD [Thermomonas flagellata]|uniref:protein BatD n=1 Tax=Thermomonas flagellata TaxID=2888524 RepID=UPI001F03F5C4|nr:protein BatD [Thermomonas flagellata]